MMPQPAVIAWRCTVIISVLIASACAGVPSSDSRPPSIAPDLAWQMRKSEIGQYMSWRLNGRVAIKSTQDSWTASIYWQQRNSTFDIQFMTHFGRVVARLQGYPGRAVLHTPDEEFSANDVSELLRKYFGWAMPVQGLRYWVLGLPDPRFKENRQLDEWGRLSWLEQSGWRVEFVDYRDVDGMELPRKILLKHPELHVRLIIDQWEPDISGVALGRLGRQNVGRRLPADDVYDDR